MKLTRQFLDHSLGVAREFVQTVIVVDDEAFSTIVETPTGNEIVRAPVLAPGDVDAAEPLVAAEERSRSAERGAAEADATDGLESIPGDAKEAATKEDIAETLDARKLIALFALQGLICGVLQPEKDDPTLQEEAVNAARRADVVILDWILHRDGGATAMSLIKAILADDNTDRLRLIVIYTGQPQAKLEPIARRIEQELPPMLELKRHGSVLANRSTRIAIHAKKTSDDAGGSGITINDLPGCVYREFAELCAGLVANVALKGIALLRSSTHALLNRLHRSLDAAFLTHRLLLPTPDDAGDFIVDIVGQEILALLHGFDVAAAANLDAIQARLADFDNGATAARAALEVETSEKVIELLRVGATAWSASLGDPQKKAGFENAAHRSATMLFEENENAARDLDREFAFRSAMIDRYRVDQPAPRLMLGTVLVSRPAAGKSATFYICVQPLCDCVRITEARRFVFVEARKDSKPSLIAKHNGAWIRLKAMDKATYIRQFVFEPQGTGVVCGVPHEDEFILTTTDGASFAWRGQMKFAQAQRLAQQVSANLARVGLDESEWLRRWARQTGDDGD